MVIFGIFWGFYSFLQKKLQFRENSDLTENAFWSISQELEDLQKPTICHFKGNFIITNLSKCLEVLRPKILPPDLKTSRNFFLVHPLLWLKNSLYWGNNSRVVFFLFILNQSLVWRFYDMQTSLLLSNLL